MSFRSYSALGIQTEFLLINRCNCFLALDWLQSTRPSDHLRPQISSRTPDTACHRAPHAFAVALMQLIDLILGMLRRPLILSLSVLAWIDRVLVQWQDVLLAKLGSRRTRTSAIVPCWVRLRVFTQGCCSLIAAICLNLTEFLAWHDLLGAANWDVTRVFCLYNSLSWELESERQGHTYVPLVNRYVRCTLVRLDHLWADLLRLA